MAPSPEVHHSALNATFKGIQRDERGPVHQFLGIKYASVPGRFEKSEPVNDFAGAVVDATKYGYDTSTSCDLP
jgi:carboxylesterase type B